LPGPGLPVYFRSGVQCLAIVLLVADAEQRRTRARVVGADGPADAAVEHGIDAAEGQDRLATIISRPNRIKDKIALYIPI
jgi:hypothetical protein